MRWEDEPFVKLYTRDTASWALLDWRARGLVVQLARKVDRAGILKVGTHGLRGFAALLGVPFQEAEPFIQELLDADKIRWNPDRGEVVLVDHFEMQNAVASDTARKRKQRQTDRTLAMEVPAAPSSRESGAAACPPERPEAEAKSELEPESDDPVTRGHARSPGVTRGHAESRSEERSSEQKRDPPKPPTGGGGVDAPKAPRPEPAPVRQRDDGTFGMTAESWREGVRAATGSTVSALSPVHRGHLFRLIEAHAEGRSGTPLLDWVQAMASDYARHELADTGGRFGITPERADRWIVAGCPPPAKKPGIARMPERRAS